MLEAIIKKLKKSKQLNRIKNKYPMLTLNGIIKPLGKLRYKNEERLFLGKEIVASSGKPSILFFTIHKCASTLVVKIIKELSEKHKIIPIDLDSYILTHKNNDKTVYQNDSFLNNVYHSKGFYYGALRYFRRVPKMEDYKTFLMLRDPRDVITSMYFSIGFSHTVFNEKLLEKRNIVKDQSIDEFVLESIPRFKKRYEDYINNVHGKENVLFLKYEEMVSDFPTWLNKMSKWLGIYDETVVNKFISEISFKPRKEDKHSHIRNVQPGDHLNKLQPTTIEILNRELKDVLIALNYTKE